MPRSLRLSLLQRFLSSPKQFSSEWRETQRELSATQQELSATKQALEIIKKPRTHHLKAAYERQVSRLQHEFPEEEAMSMAVGGLFEQVGNLEVALLRNFGLQPDSYLIDVGCGSGRLAKPLASYLRGPYLGVDLVADLVEHARKISGRPDWRFEVIDHIEIPERDSRADMVCFFSVLTHLLHEQSYWYLEEAVRVLKPGGKIVFSFLDFAEPGHWYIFMETLQHSKSSEDNHLNVFISKDMIKAWSLHLRLEIERFVGGEEVAAQGGALGQSLCILRKL